MKQYCSLIVALASLACKPEPAPPIVYSSGQPELSVKSAEPPSMPTKDPLAALPSVAAPRKKAGQRHSKPLPETPLVIFSPGDGEITTDSAVTVKGTAQRGAKVTVNGKRARVDRRTGAFRGKVKLPLGRLFEVIVTAEAKGKRSTTKTVRVFRQLTLRQQADLWLGNDGLTYPVLEKNPSRFRGLKTMFRGQIFHIRESGNDTLIQMNVTHIGWGVWQDQLMVTFSGTTPFVKGDVVRVYGTVAGAETYRSTAGWILTAPLLRAKYILQ